MVIRLGGIKELLDIIIHVEVRKEFYHEQRRISTRSS